MRHKSGLVSKLSIICINLVSDTTMDLQCRKEYFIQIEKLILVSYWQTLAIERNFNQIYPNLSQQTSVTTQLILIILCK